MVSHPSRSDAQQEAEQLAVLQAALQFGVELTPKRIDMGDGVFIQIDGATADNSMLVEVYAHVGPLRSGQARKLATDAFKLIWAGARLGSTRLVIAVVDDHTATYLRRPKAWLSAALVDNHVDVVQVALPESVSASIADAQKAQYR